MTTILGLLVSVTLLTSPFTKSVINNETSPVQTERVANVGATFSVQNTTPVNVGIVTVNEADQNSVNIVVGGQGTFSATLSASAVGVIINGQNCPRNVPTVIMVNEQTTVRATWTADIIVIDQDATH